MSATATNVLISAAILISLPGGLKLQGMAVERGLLGGAVSRKFAHISLGVFLVVSWLLYLPTPSARWVASLVPATLVLFFVLLGAGTVGDETVIKAGSRTGHRSEFLFGPVFFALSFSLLTVLYWRTSPVGVAALMVLVVGDGLGEVVGKAVPGPRLPWNSDKSFAGSATVFVGGWAAAAAMIGLFSALGYMPAPWSSTLAPLAWVALVGTAVESLPLREIDNLTIPAACAAAGHLLLI